MANPHPIQLAHLDDDKVTPEVVDACSLRRCRPEAFLVTAVEAIELSERDFRCGARGGHHPLIARKAKRTMSWNVIGGCPLSAALRRRDLFPGNQCLCLFYSPI